MDVEPAAEIVCQDLDVIGSGNTKHSSPGDSTNVVVPPLIEDDTTERSSSEKASHEDALPSRSRSDMRRYYDFLRIVVFTVYHQLFSVVCLANLAAIAIIVTKIARGSGLPLDEIAVAAVANLTAATLIRQDYVRNILFHICWSIPHSAPLWVRSRLAKIYENGGIHSGGALCATSSYLIFVGCLTKEFIDGHYQSIALLVLSWGLLATLLAITIFAIPHIRHRHHNLFENTHRLGGWLSILLFWPILVLFVHAKASHTGDELALDLVRSPLFWLLIILSIHVVYPWVLLRKVPVVKVEHLSDHAVRLYFSPKEAIRPLHGLAISDSVLREWHSFAAIPDVDGSDGGASSCIVSKAGDWTSKTVECPAKYYYMRGCHFAGTMHMAKVFKRVVIMATGSGVGPCLSLFGHAPHTKVRFLWFASKPKATFGEKIITRVLKQDPEAVIWDTKNEGQKRPDIVRMAKELYTTMEAEAVFFISNKGLTKKVVHGLESQGVPTYAPVFDS